jgi:NAD(P)H-hydrate epimerase
VIDADALNMISKNQYLFNFFHENLILTPHMGEMSRLTGKSIESIKNDPILDALHFLEKKEWFVC